MKVLVTGAKGMLGQDLCQILRNQGFEVFESDVDNMDITNNQMVKTVFFLHIDFCGDKDVFLTIVSSRIRAYIK